MKENIYRKIIDKCYLAYSIHKVICDGRGVPCGLECTESNEAYEGIPKELAAGLPDRFSHIAIQGGEAKDEVYFAPENKWYSVTASSPYKEHLLIICQDITKEKGCSETIYSLLDFSADFLCILDADCNFLAISHYMQRLLGYKLTDLLEANAFDYIHPADSKSVIEAAEQMGYQKEPSVLPIRFLSKKGEYEAIKIKAAKKNTLYYVFIEDKVELDALQYDENTLFFNSVPTQIWYLSDEQTYYRANKAHADFLGKDVDDFSNKNMYELLPKDEADVCAIGNRKIIKGRRMLSYKEWLTNANGEKRLISISKTPIFDNDGCIKYLICIADDITESSYLEEQNFTKENILSTIVAFSKETVDLDSLAVTIPKSLALLGSSLHIDRVYYWENYYDPKRREWFTSQRYEWSSEGVEPQINRPDLQNIPFKDVGDFMEPLAQRKAFVTHIKDLPDTITKEILQSQQILSILVLPIFINDRFWGFVGYDSCKKEKNWNDIELMLLKNYVLIVTRTIEMLEAKKDLERLNSSLMQSGIAKEVIINDANIATIIALAKITAIRDGETGNHLERVSEISVVIARNLRRKSYYSIIIDDEFIECIKIASLLHDIGKIAVKDSILLKEGELSEEEYDEMKRHTILGGESLKSVCAKYGGNNYLQMAIDIAYFHHEKWDGSGYPYGKIGDDIPLSAQIVAISDVYDALRSKRPYKKAFDEETAKQIICDGKSKQFNPFIVEALVISMPEIRRIYEKYAD